MIKLSLHTVNRFVSEIVLLFLLFGFLWFSLSNSAFAQDLDVEVQLPNRLQINVLDVSLTDNDTGLYTKTDADIQLDNSLNWLQISSQTNIQLLVQLSNNNVFNAKYLNAGVFDLSKARNFNQNKAVFQLLAGNQRLKQKTFIAWIGLPSSSLTISLIFN